MNFKNKAYYVGKIKYLLGLFATAQLFVLLIMFIFYMA